MSNRRRLPPVDLLPTGITAATYGGATTVPQITVNAQGQITAETNVTISGTAPGGAAGGDLSSTYPNPTVARINGVTLGTVTATAGRILTADGAQWSSQAVGGDASITSTGALTVWRIAGVTLGSVTATAGRILTADGAQWSSQPVSGDGSMASTGAMTVTRINGVTLGTVTATAGRILTADGAQWSSVAMSGDATIASTGALTLASGALGASAGGRLKMASAFFDFPTVVDKFAVFSIGWERLQGKGASGTGAAVTLGAQTITAAEMLQGYFIHSAGSNDVATTPTGTLLGGQITGAAAGVSFDIVVVNTAAANTIQIAAGTDCTLVGTAALFTLAAASAKTFRVIFRSATTYDLVAQG